MVSKAYCPVGHLLQCQGVPDDGWRCDGADRPNGCRSGIYDFDQTAGLERFSCEICEFDLCRACAETWKEQPVTNLAPRVEEGLFGALGNSDDENAPHGCGDLQRGNSDSEGAMSELSDGEVSDASDISASARWRNDRGISIVRMGRTPACTYKPIVRFDELLKRGVPQSVVDTCRGCVGTSSDVQPTAVQAEFWGLLLNQCHVPLPASPGWDPGLRPPPQSPVGSRAEDVAVPDSDSDLECEGTDKESYVDSAPLMRCEVRESIDVVAIAPTGSGKTMAYLLPLMADGLCSERRAAKTAAEVWVSFQDLFPLSFPTANAGNAALLSRCQALVKKSDTKTLHAFLIQVASKAISGTKSTTLLARWNEFVADCNAIAKPISPAALVLAPTRELAWQVGQVASMLKAASSTVIGGVDSDRQRENLLEASPALIVATPGRLCTLCGVIPSSTRRRMEESGTAPEALPSSPVVCLSQVRRLMLDEGDRLLDEGFEEDVLCLASMAGNRRMSTLLSATWSSRVEVLASVLRSDSSVRITVPGVPTTIEQAVELVPRAARGKRLREVLRELGTTKALVFVLLRREARDLSRMLSAEGWSCWALQGNMSQSARATAMQSFREAESAVLVATDVAARGLDIQGVRHVVNFSLGLSVDSYVHRIGRCGRAGREGRAITFVTDGDERHAASLLRVLKLAGQRVPQGLAEMADAYERSGGTEQFAVKKSCAKGEAKLVRKPQRAEQKPAKGTASPKKDRG